MNKLLSIMAVLCMTFLFVGCNKDGETTDTTTEAAEMSNVYTNEEYGIEINYPADWTKQELGPIAVLMSPTTSEEDTFQESVSFIAQAFPGGEDMDLNSYTDLTTGQLKEMIEGFDSLEVKDVEFLGSPAKEISYVGTQEGMNLKWKQIFTIDEGNA
ncbi:MAG: hypothetical protein OEL89_04595, partial [Candidatus Peregrinibacteria bacterium]|nr:hypothetical protein [Candidatus Peregrinibacteria bacterium]